MISQLPNRVELKNQFLGKGDLIGDAWGRQKVVQDFSLIHGMWTYDVPNRVWEEYSVAAGVYTALAATGTLATSVGGMLEVASGTTANNGCALSSKRHPRYQPNRGHLYSTAVIMPNPTGDGIRTFGLKKFDNGVYFELEGTGTAWELYAVRKSDGTVKMRQALSSLLPSGFDVSKGHVYDIQYQWRGVGNYRFFVDLHEIYADEVLGTLSEISVAIPALPVFFESVTHTTTELTFSIGCVDVTSEGGKPEGRQFSSISTGTTLLTCDANGVAMIGIKLPRTLSYGGGTVYNTRDIVASKISSWTRDEASVQVWMARDTIAVTLDALTWSTVPDSVTQYLIGGQSSVLDAAFTTDKASMQLVLNEWDDMEVKNTIYNPDQDAAAFFLSPGDIMIVAVQSFLGNDDNSTTLYMSEEL